MLSRYIKIISAAFASIILIYFLLTILPVFAQELNWLVIRDEAGNRYYVNNTGKIFTEEKPEFSYKAVSREGLDYYLAQGEILTQKFYKEEGLYLLKSICCLPGDDFIVVKARERSVQRINQLRQREGTRFREMNESASMLFYTDGQTTYAANDLFGYHFKSSGSLTLLKKRLVRPTHGLRQSLQLAGDYEGNPLTSETKNSVHDFILAIDGEQFPFDLSGVEDYKNKIDPWLVDDSLERKSMDVTKKSELLFFTAKGDYCGYELFMVKENKGIIIRIISSKKNFDINKARLLDVMHSFSF